ncbi:MAG TPA: glycerate kinase [Prolixibacteraceae bacterium]|nr:glycerate kinase [Prolixibacteraceae bacterium]HPS12025.1 glycerate kinase [Prolixibacteraceae bacterium]
MNVLIAPNSMKGTLSAFAFADAIERGLNKAGITRVIKLPVADGGDGTAEILDGCYRADFIPCKALDPLKREIGSGYFMGDDHTAIVEMASASGLKWLFPSEYSALDATSYGTGQLIADAVRKGAKHILIGVGGSASVDGGMGALMALGVKFVGKEGEITEGNGRQMGNVLRIEDRQAREFLKDVKLTILTDVRNPLLGTDGAARVFAPQKGATPMDVEVLEKNMALFAGSLFQATGNDISQTTGGGAAGGISASFHALFGAEIVDGASFILEKLNFRELARSADVIITGEGKIDRTTYEGKAPGVVLKIASELGKPVYAICGECELEDDSLFKSVIPLVNRNISRREACEIPAFYVEVASEIIGKTLKRWMRNS